MLLLLMCVVAVVVVGTPDQLETNPCDAEYEEQTSCYRGASGIRPCRDGYTYQRGFCYLIPAKV